MLFNKILENIIKICVLENFSKFEVKFVPICSKRVQIVSHQYAVAVFSNRNMGLKRIPKF